MRERLPDLTRFRSVGVDTSWVMSQDALNVLVSVLSFTLIVHAFGPENYGAYLGAYGIIAPLTGLAWNGVALTILQRGRQDHQDPVVVARNAFSLTLSVGLVVSLAAIALANVWVPSLTLTEIVFLVTGEMLGAAPILLSGSLVQVTDGIPAAARVRMGMVGLRAATLVVLKVTGLLTILNLGMSVTAVFGIYAAWLVLFRLPRSGIRVTIGAPTRDYANTAAAFAVPIIASSIQMDSDKTALNYYGYQKTAGLYGTAFRLVQFAAIPINSIEAVAFHRFLDSDHTMKGQQVRRAAKSAAVTLSVSLVAAVSLFVAAPLVVKIAGNQFVGSVVMVRWLVLWLPVYAITTAPINGLMALKRLGTRAAILIASGILSVACYIAFIPSMSWKGGLIGTIVGELFTAIIGWSALLYFQRLHDARIDATTPQPTAVATP